MASTAGPLLRSRISRSGRTITVTLSGELDIATGGELQARLATVVHDEPAPRRVVLDLSDLAFVDASGIGVLLAARRDLASRGGELVLRRPSRLVRRVLDVLDPRGELAVEP